MRPRFNPDTCYIPMHDGVYLRNNDNGLVLKGKSLYQLLEHLVPNLNGQTTLEQITEGLDADRRRMITKLIEKLHAHHFLQDASHDALHLLAPTMHATYASDVTFIASFPTSTATQFERFRNTRLLLIGSGPGFTAVVQASQQCGVKQINTLITPEHATDISAASHPPEPFSPRDAEQTVLAIDAPNWDNEIEVLNAIQPYDVILHISDQPILARAQQLNKFCVELQKLFVQAVVVDDHAWVGPLVSPDADGCWECAWRRLQANLTSGQRSHYTFHNQPTSSQLLTASTATIVASRLIFELFKHLTNTGFTKTAEMLTDIDLETFQSTGHTFLPHPHCLACQHPTPVPTTKPFRQQIKQQQPDPIHPDELFERMASCVENTLGLFTEVGDDNFVQTPLAVYRVRLSDPMPTSDPRKPLDVIATSIDTIDSRVRACRKACERYAAHFVDQRRLLSHETIHQLALPAMLNEQLIGTQPAQSIVEAWICTLDLQTRQDVFVPATLAFPALQPAVHEAEYERGVASGTSWKEAICLALLDWSKHLTLAELRAAQDPYAQIDLARMPMTPDGSYLLHLLEVANVKIAVYDITGSLHVPTFAFCSDEKAIAYATHCDVAQALSMGLMQILQQCQADQFQQPAYKLAAVPDLPFALRGDHVQMPRYDLPETWSARLPWLLQQFQTSGLRVLAMPLDHEPALQQVLPFIVRVLLARAEVQHEV